VLLFSGWAVVWKLLVAVLIGFALLMGSRATGRRAERPSLDWAAGAWLAPYLVGMGVLSYLGSFDPATPSAVPFLGLTGPRNVLHGGWDLAAVAVFSLAVYRLALRLRLPAERCRDYVGDLTAEAGAERVAGGADGAGR
jgi:hypothetical protein